jgi:branched-chain amino acid transport system substrate-binding protein
MQVSKWRRRAGIVFGLVLAAAAIAACGSSSSSTSASGSSTSSGSETSAASSSKSPFNILYISGLSGPLSVYGANGLEGVKAAAAVVNQSGGIDGHPIVVSSKDDASQGSNAATELAAALSSGTKPNVVINGVDGDEGLATNPGLTQAKVIGMNIDPSIVDVSKYPYEFSLNTAYPSIMTQMASTFAAHGVHKLAIVYVAADQGTQELAELTSAAKKLAIDVVSQVSYAPTALSLSPEWLRAAAAHPDAYALLTQGQGPIALKGRGAAGITAYTLCDSSCGANPLATLVPPAGLKNAYTMTDPIALTAPASRTQGQQTFVSELQKLGYPNDLVVPGLEYDFVLMLAQAGRQAGSIDAAALKSALEHSSLAKDQTALGIPEAFTSTDHTAESGANALVVFATGDRQVKDVFTP